MQLSIIIPTYNFVCTKLVSDLANQCSASSLLDDYEIIVVSDGSSNKQSILQNREINNIKNCQFIENDQNIGRSRILHNYTKKTKFPWVMIIDSDAEVCSRNFIDNYLNHTKDQDVVCGGITISEKYKTQDNTLRYKYEQNASGIRALNFRTKYPYQHFSSFNILINAKVFKLINFDNSLEQYGYEDTLFGINLKRNNFRILHIDNPLIHTGIDSNPSYLHKTEQALQNLVKLRSQLQEGSVLYQYYLKLRKWHLTETILIWHNIFSRLERRNILSHHPSLFVFKVYKLGYFIKEIKREATLVM